MNSPDLLRAVRDVYLLVPKPGTQDEKDWAIPLAGLHQDHIKIAVKQLRQKRQRRGETISQDSLKPKSLQNGITKAISAKSYDDWVSKGQQQLFEFLKENDLSRPTNLIAWKNGPCLTDCLRPPLKTLHSRAPMRLNESPGPQSLLFF